MNHTGDVEPGKETAVASQQPEAVEVTYTVTRADRAVQRRLRLRWNSRWLRVVEAVRILLGGAFFVLTVVGLVIVVTRSWGAAFWIGIWWSVVILWGIPFHFAARILLGRRVRTASRAVMPEGIRVQDDDWERMVPWVEVMVAHEDHEYIAFVGDYFQVYEIPKRLLDEWQLERLRALVPPDLRARLHTGSP